MPLSQAQQSPRSPSEAQEQQRSRNRRALTIAAALLFVESRTERAISKSAESLDDVGADVPTTAAAIATIASSLLLKAKSAARAVSRDAMHTVDPLTGEVVVPGAAVAPASEVQAAIGAQVDQSSAERAGQSVGRRYVEASADPEIADAVEALDAQIHKTTVTEAWAAMNDETARAADSAAAAGADLWLVWSSLADACFRCSARHGERVHVSEGLIDWPPLHAHCRCVVLTESE